MININKLDRSKDWGGIFDQLDENFNLIADYLKSIGNRVKIERFIATDQQREFSLPTPYNTKRNCLAIYKNNTRIWLYSEDNPNGFRETSNTTFMLLEPCQAGDEIIAVYNQYYELGDNTPMEHLILKSPSGYYFKLEVDDYGNLSVLECPKPES